MFSDPVKNLKTLGIRDNDIIADLGAGTGFYSLAVAKMTTKGKVYAIEIIKDYLTTIAINARNAHLQNIEIIWGNVEQIRGTKIADKILDKVIASNILFQVEHKENFVKEIKRILKPAGKVLLIDWQDTSSAIGPSFNNLVPVSKALALFENAGFKKEKDIDAGEHHYGMILVIDK